MKVIQTILNLFFLAGTILLLILLILSSSTKISPINQIYWLKADTSSIENAFSQSQWGFWGVCDSGNLSDCITGPAFPLSPQDNFETTENIPQDFIDNRNTYFYLSRFAFAFGLIAFALASLTFVISIFGLCFLVVDKVTAFIVTLATFFLAGFAAFQTAVVILARNAFRDQNLYVHVPTISMAFLWASLVCILIVWVNTIGANITNSWKKHMSNVQDHDQQMYQNPQQVPINDASSFTREAPPKDEDTTGGIRFFKIKRNQKVNDDESV